MVNRLEWKYSRGAVLAQILHEAEVAGTKGIVIMLSSRHPRGGGCGGGFSLM